MTVRHPGDTPSALTGRVYKGLGVLVLLAGLTACVLFSVHTLVSVDLGYHLAYGRWMIEHGQILSANQFSYSHAGHPFVNANWLFQVVLAGVDHTFGPVGLSVCLSLLIVGLAGSLAFWMHLRGVSPAISGVAIAAVALTCYERFTLRPELVSLLCLVWTLILVETIRQRPKASVIGLAIVQLLWVNCHSYFLLAIAIVGMHLVFRLVQSVVARMRRRRDPNAELLVRRLGLAVAVMAACTLINPSGVTGAIFPLQTLAYLQTTDAMAGGPGGPGGGPWGVISEFGWSLNRAKIPLALDAFYRLALVLGVVAIVLQLVRRKLLDFPAAVLLLPASLVMRRNIPLWAVLAWPAVAECLHWLAGMAQAKLGPRRSQRVAGIVSVGMAIALTALCWNVASSCFYVRERRERRFGTGTSQLAYVAEGAAALADHRIKGQVYCQFEVGSYLLYFAKPRRPVLVHSNTFAYPPDFFGLTVRSQNDRAAFDELADRYGINVVLLKHTQGRSHGLIRSLAHDDAWPLIFFDHNSAVFVRNIPAHRALIAEHEIRPTAIDLAGWNAALTAQDPTAPGLGMVYVGNLFASLGWSELARSSYHQAVEADPGLYEAWNQLGVYWGSRAGTAATLGDGPRQRQCNLKALECFEKAIDANPDYEYAKRNLAIARQNLGMP